MSSNIYYHSHTDFSTEKKDETLGVHCHFPVRALSVLGCFFVLLLCVYKECVLVIFGLVWFFFFFFFTFDVASCTPLDLAFGKLREVLLGLSGFV